jgi:hypothetical protein
MIFFGFLVPYRIVIGMRCSCVREFVGGGDGYGFWLFRVAVGGAGLINPAHGF